MMGGNKQQAALLPPTVTKSELKVPATVPASNFRSIVVCVFL